MKVYPPLLGVSEGKAYSEQEPGTTRRARNARGEDPTDGQEKIAQRSGLTDFTTAKVQVNGANPVRLVAPVTFDVPVLTYTGISDATLQGAAEWTYSQDSRAAVNVVRDDQNATYWLFGKDVLVKLNMSGELVWTFSIPLLEETHVARALRVDGAGNIFVASTCDQEFSDSSFDAIPVDAVMENSRIWRLVQISDPEKDEERVEVSVEFAVDGFVSDLYLRHGYVYFLQNRPDRYEADLGIVQGFNVGNTQVSAQPSLLALRGVPYPASSLVVNKAAEIVVACEPFNQRLTNPKYPGLSKTSNLFNLPGMWTWRRNLPDAEARGWSEYRADAQGLANGSAAATLSDLTGNSRDFTTAEADAITGDARDFTEPTYFANVLGDAGGLRFDGVLTGMATARNSSLDYRDRGGGQRTAWPSYGGITGTTPNKVTESTSAQFAFFFLGRLPRLAARGAIIGQESPIANMPPVTAHGRCPFALVANRPQSETRAVAAVAGKITLYDYIGENAVAADFASGYTPNGPRSLALEARFPREADLLGIRAAPNNSADPEEPPIALITFVVDNAVDTGTIDTGATRGLLRVNGRPIDRWEGSIRITQERVTLGFASDFGADGVGAEMGVLNGDVIYGLCIARKDPTVLTEPKVLTHQPTRPRNKINNIQGTATSGNFTLTVHYPDGTADQTTANIAFNASAATVEAALEALAGLISTDVSVTGTAVNTVGVGVNVIFGHNQSVAKPVLTGVYQGIDLPLMTVNNVSLGGGTVLSTLAAPIDGGIAGSDLPHAVTFDQELELIEGEIAHFHGIQHLFPQVGEPFQHPFALRPPLDPEAVDPTSLFSTTAIIAKYSTGDMSLIWALTDLGGVGYGLAIDEDDDLYSLGPKQASPASAIEYRKIVDNGDTTTLGFSGAFTPDGWTTRHPKAVVDKFKTWYIPRSPTVDTAMHTVVMLTDAGAAEGLYDTNATAANRLLAYAVEVASPPPEYPTVASLERSEFLFVATDPDPVGAGPVVTQNARKVRLVSIVHAGTPPRQTKLVVAAGGTVKYATAGGYTAITGGTGILSSTSPLITAARFGGKLYINDQVRTYVLDPRTDTIALLKSEDGGEVPERAHFLFQWRGHLGWARLDDKPGFIKLARTAKPTHLNLSPNPIFPGRAWKGSSSLDIGEMPDIINSVAPISNSLLGVFGDKTVTLFQGEPTFGGQITETSHLVGGAYGKCWSWDKRERLFFMSNFGEVYHLPIGGTPECISDARIKRTLQDIDFSKHYVWADWNWLDDTVHFWLIPYGAAEAVSHWVLDTKRGRLAFFEDTIGDLLRQPTCVGTFDGDLPTDRRMILGCADGRTRVWNPTAKDDDGVGIGFDVLYALVPSGTESAWSFSELEVALAPLQDGCLAQLIPAEHAARLDEENAQGPVGLVPGYNPASWLQATGNYCYLRLYQMAPGKRTAIEEVNIMADAAGPRRLESRA